MNILKIRKAKVNRRQLTRRIKAAYIALSKKINYTSNNSQLIQNKILCSVNPKLLLSIHSEEINDFTKVMENCKNSILRCNSRILPRLEISALPTSNSNLRKPENKNDNLQTETLEFVLKEWVFDCRPKISHVDKLLRALNKFPLGETLPRTYETLMCMPRNLVFRDVDPGRYFHVGVIKSIICTLEYYNISEIKDNQIIFDVNIDGLPIYETNSAQFWPILGHIKNIPQSNPFVIGIYYGYAKPDCAENFLKDFIEEMLEINSNGIKISNELFKLELRAIICDMPAKAFVKSVKGHNAYYSCHMCIQNGEYLNGRLCFPEIDATVRSDESFRQRRHEEHHLNDGIHISPFEKLKYIDMIWAFPLDYMHLLLLGVTKKLLTMWRSGNLNVRMSGNVQADITRRLLTVKKTQSRHFSRRSRELSELKYWRSTEFRTFLLYTGPVILENQLPPSLYNNFLYLHVATKLCTKDDLKSYLNIAQRLYYMFVNTFEDCYGVHLISSNVHNTIHLTECVKRYGVLDNFSAFPHEATLGKIKGLVEKNSDELQQVAKRHKTYINY